MFYEDARDFIINKVSNLNKLGKIGNEFCYQYLGGSENNIKANEDKISVFKENEVLKENENISDDKSPKITAEKPKDEFLPILPVNAMISSPYGKRIHPITNEESFHTGLDFKVDKNTNVVCVSDGEVIKSEYDDINGNFIIIKHNEKYKSAYVHLEKRLVNAGDKVTKGEIIALSGESGRATGPHLHFEIKEFDKAIDPFSIIK